MQNPSFEAIESHNWISKS